MKSRSNTAKARYYSNINVCWTVPGCVCLERCLSHFHVLGQGQTFGFFFFKKKARSDMTETNKAKGLHRVLAYQQQVSGGVASLVG